MTFEIKFTPHARPGWYRCGDKSFEYNPNATLARATAKLQIERNPLAKIYPANGKLVMVSLDPARKFSAAAAYEGEETIEHAMQTLESVFGQAMLPGM